jgi:hypothetical protein
MGTADSTTRVASEKPVWQSPKLQELGNIRRFVQVGNANGKSYNLMDGSANCGGEAMSDGGNCIPQ